MKKNKAYLEKAFPVAYVANHLNGTKAYKAVKGQHLKDTTATVEASKLLRNPNVQKSIEALLPKEEETMRVLADAYAAPREKIMTYKELHKFWETDLKLRGKLTDKAQSQVNIGIIIKE